MSKVQNTRFFSRNTPNSEINRLPPSKCWKMAKICGKNLWVTRRANLSASASCALSSCEGASDHMTMSRVALGPALLGTQVMCTFDACIWLPQQYRGDLSPFPACNRTSKIDRASRDARATTCQCFPCNPVRHCREIACCTGVSFLCPLQVHWNGTFTSWHKSLWADPLRGSIGSIQTCHRVRCARCSRLRFCLHNPSRLCAYRPSHLPSCGRSRSRSTWPTKARPAAIDIYAFSTFRKMVGLSGVFWKGRGASAVAARWMLLHAVRMRA